MKLLHLWTCTTGQSHRAQSKQRRTTVPHRTTTPSPWHWDSTTPPLLNPLTLDWWSSSKWGEENAQVYIATSIKFAQVELTFGCWPQRKNKYYWPQWHMDSSADRQNASFTIRFLQACQCHCSRCKLRSSLHFPQQSGNQQFSWTHGDRKYKKLPPSLAQHRHSHKRNRSRIFGERREVILGQTSIFWNLVVYRHNILTTAIATALGPKWSTPNITTSII